MNHMLKPVTTLSLIALVLICPYLCLGEAVGVVEEPLPASTCCCHDQDEHASDKSPESPCDGDSDCLCQGAVFERSRTVDDELMSSPAISWLLAVTSSSTNLSLAAVSFESPHQFPPFSTGRDVCTLTCTLQL